MSDKLANLAFLDDDMDSARRSKRSIFSTGRWKQQRAEVIKAIIRPDRANEENRENRCYDYHYYYYHCRNLTSDRSTANIQPSRYHLYAPTPLTIKNRVKQPNPNNPHPNLSSPYRLCKIESMCFVTPYRYTCPNPSASNACTGETYKETRVDCERKPCCTTSYNAPVILDNALCENCEQRQEAGSDVREGRAQEPTLLVDILEVATDGTSDVKASLVGGLRQGKKIRVEISLLGGGS